MKQNVSGPVLAIILVVVIAALGYWLYHSMQSASGTSTPTAGPSVDPFAKKPDFSKMTPEQIEQMKKGGMGAMMRPGGGK